MTADLKAFRTQLSNDRLALERTLQREELRELQAERDLTLAREARARAQGALGIINDALLRIPDAPPSSPNPPPKGDPTPTPNPPSSGPGAK